MKTLLVMLLFSLSLSLPAKGSDKPINIPSCIYFDTFYNSYQEKMMLSGITFRIWKIGMGYHFNIGYNELNENSSGKPLNPIYTKKITPINTQFIDYIYYHDLPELNTSININLGLGVSNYQNIEISNNSMNIYRSHSQFEFVYGAGFTYHPYGAIILGVTFDNIRKVSFNLGLGFTVINNESFPINKYFE